MPVTADPANEKARSFIDTFLGAPKTPEPPKPEDPAKPAEPVKPAEGTAPAEPPKVDEPVKAVEAPKAAEPAKSADPAKPAEPEPPKAAEPAKPKKAKREEPAVDYERVAESAARGVAEAMAKQTPAAAAPAPDVLPESERRRIAYLAQLEKLYPEKYADVSKKYERSYREIDKYQRAWEQANPGETFDADAPEHSTFLAKHAVDWEDEDYAEAVAEVKANVVRQETERRYEEQARKQTLEPEARKAGRTYADTVLTQLNPELKSAAELLGDGLTLDPEKLEKLVEADPVKGPVVAKAVEFAAQFVTESNRLFNGVATYNERSPLHRQINDFAVAKEKALLALPRDQQLDSEGRRFVATSEYYKLPAAQRAQAWTLQAEDLAYLATKEIVEDAKKSIASEEARIERVLKARGLASQKPAPAAAAAPAKPADPAVSKPVSPSGGVDPKLAGVKGDPATESAERWSAFTNRFLGVK